MLRHLTVVNSIMGLVDFMFENLFVQQLDVATTADSVGLSGGPLAEPYKVLQLHFHWGSDNTKVMMMIMMMMMIMIMMMCLISNCQLSDYHLII